MQSKCDVASVRIGDPVLILHIFINVMIAILLLLSFSTYADDCDQINGNIAAKRGDISLAFSMLRFCEHNKDISGETLHMLAAVYMNFAPAQAQFNTDKKLAKKVYDLLYRASIKGYEDALIDLASFYESGEPLLGILPSESIGNCLHKVADSRSDISTGAVNSCLGFSGTAKP